MIVREEMHLPGSLAALAGVLCSGSELGSLPESAQDRIILVCRKKRKWALGRTYFFDVISVRICASTILTGSPTTVQWWIGPRIEDYAWKESNVCAQGRAASCPSPAADGWASIT